MMVSEVKYPSFKNLNLGVQRPFGKLVVGALFLGVLLVLREQILPVVLPVIFTAYLLYGFIRPRISRKMREEIEEEEAPDRDDARP
jgi:CDP-diacylglycerol--serine O-phosphatidyltransferase